MPVRGGGLAPRLPSGMLRSQSLSIGSACCLPLHLPLVTNYCIMAHEIIPSDRRRPPGPAAPSRAVHHRKPTSRNEKVLNSNVQICSGQLRLLPPRRERPNRELPTVRNRREVKGFCLRYQGTGVRKSIGSTPSLFAHPCSAHQGGWFGAT